MSYYVTGNIVFEDGFSIEDVEAERLSVEEMDALEDEHGRLTFWEIDGYPAPLSVFRRLGLDGILDTLDYINQHHVDDIPALFVYMEDNKYSDAPYSRFEENYVGQFRDDAAFAVYIRDNYDQWEDIPEYVYPYVDWVGLVNHQHEDWYEEDHYYFWR